MLRDLALLLMIATPLLSQDLLVDSEGREFKVTLIEITDTFIYFQKPREIAIVQLPLESVERVVLANGSIAYNDGKIYIYGKIYVEDTGERDIGEREPIQAEPLGIDLGTGLPLEEPPEKQPPRFDPKTGELIPARPVPAISKPPTRGTTRIAQQRIIALALADARRHQSDRAGDFGAALLGAGAVVGGAIFGAITTDSFPGFLLGAAVGSLAVPLMHSLNPVSIPPSPQLEDAAPDQRETYRQTYIGEARKLRGLSVFKAELVLLASVAGGLMLLLLVS